MVGISFFGGIAHLMLYIDGFWSNTLWVTAIAVVLIPILIKKQLKGRKFSFRRARKSKAKPKIEGNDLFAKVEGNCKICGKALSERGIDFCSQKCSFEFYLNNQSKNTQNEIEPQLFPKRPHFSFQ